MVTYMVQPGDTVWKIAQQFGVTIEAIVSANNLANPDQIFAGQILLIPTVAVPPSPRPVPPPPPPPPPIPLPPGFRVYVVQPGDTLAAIAARFGTTVEAIVRVNNIANPDLIHVGQVLRIPVGVVPPVPPGPPMPPGPPGPPTVPPGPPTPPPPPVPLPIPGRNYVTRLEGGILYILYTNKTVYEPGEPVRIVLAKTNVTNQSITLEYRSGQRYDFLITRNDQEIWRWSRGKAFVMIIQTVTLNPGENQVFREVWTQVDNEGRPVRSGVYRLTGWNTATNVQLTLEIEIRAS